MTLDINQITWIHNIDVTLQLVSAQKDAYASELEREREKERDRSHRDAHSTRHRTQTRREFTIDFTFYKVLIIILMSCLWQIWAR